MTVKAAVLRLALQIAYFCIDAGYQICERTPTLNIQVYPAGGFLHFFCSFSVFCRKKGTIRQKTPIFAESSRQMCYEMKTNYDDRQNYKSLASTLKFSRFS